MAGRRSSINEPKAKVVKKKSPIKSGVPGVPPHKKCKVKLNPEVEDQEVTYTEVK